VAVIDGKKLRGALSKFFARETGQDAREQARGWTVQVARGPAMPDSQMYPLVGRDYVIPMFEDALLSRYARYEEMDAYPETSLVLDLYSDDATVRDQIQHHTIWAKSKDRAIQKILDKLRDDLGIEKMKWAHTRNIVKYGNAFAELLMQSKKGVVGINYLPTPTMRRVEDRKGNLLGFYQIEAGRVAQLSIRPNDFKAMLDKARSSGELDKPQPVGSGPPGSGQNIGNVILFDPSEIVHWRLRRDMRGIYGLGVLESADWVWRRLRMLEDAVMVHKLTRAPGRFAFYINTHKLPPEQAWAHVKRIKAEYKKRKFINPRTGQLDTRINPLSVDDDFWIPIVGGEEESRIETLSGPDYQGMDEVEFFLKKMYVATKIPRNYMDFAENMNKALLSSEDVRFARAVMRVQNSDIEGWNQVASTHLFLLGYKVDRVEQFTYQMAVPSAIFELAMVEVMAAKADLASRLMEFVSIRWILSHVFKWADDEIDQVFDEWAEEKVWRTIVEGLGTAEATKIQGDAELENEKKRAELERAAAGEGPAPESIQTHFGSRVGNRQSVAFGMMDKADRDSMLMMGEDFQKNIRRLLEDGNKDSEKRMEGRLQHLLLNHQDEVGKRFRVLMPFMNELRSAIRLGRVGRR
jgi:hypothetical protein